MPHIYCQKCRAPQQDNEKKCLKCGTPFGGNLFVLIAGLVSALGGPLLLFTLGRDSIGDPDRALQQVFVYWMMPILVGTLFLFDSNGKRATTYLYVGGALIIAGVLALN